ncbi:MAG: retroviral-like aspartic protease family protein [Bacteroidota bacterium]|nr:retroviral-like aspartic protease family protein [Bacteroidota bacterium]
MKTALILLFCLFSCTVGFAQISALNQGCTTAPNYYTELPYTSINGKLLVDVELYGKKHKFLFDTGAPVQLSNELTAELKLTAVNKINVGDVNGATDSTRVMRLEIKLGNVIFADVPAINVFPEVYKCWGVDGVIGSNLLRNSIVRIDADRHVIVLTDHADKLSLNPGHSLPLSTPDAQSTPVIQISLNKKLNLTLPFDTGDNGFLRFSEDLMTRLDKKGLFKTLAKGYGANQIGALGLQSNAEKYLLKIPFLMIGSTRFNNVITQTSKGGIPGVGTKLLDYGSVTLDFIHSKFYFDAKDETTDLNEKQWPFQPSLSGNKLVVGVVWDKGVNVVKPGQQIIAIDDKDFSVVNICDMVNSKPLLSGRESAIITLRDADGKEKKVPISRE